MASNFLNACALITPCLIAASSHATMAPAIVAHAPQQPLCEMLEFDVSFAADGATLAEDQRHALARNVDRARPCPVLMAFVVSRVPAQAEAVRAEMTAQGFPDELIVVTELRTPSDAQDVRPNRARIVVVFR